MERNYTKHYVLEKKWLRPKIWGFYRIPADNRNLNYSQYFSEGTQIDEKIEDYNSHNTKQEGLKGVIDLLSDLNIFKDGDQQGYSAY